MEYHEMDGKRWREVSRDRVRETIEDVTYVEQTIKKFNREGSENMEKIRIPEFTTREIDVDLVTYVCDETNEVRTVHEPVEV